MWLEEMGVIKTRVRVGGLSRDGGNVKMKLNGGLCEALRRLLKRYS